MNLIFRKILCFVGVIMLGITAFGADLKTEKPNVIVIIVDDLGWADIGYNNPEHVYSPNIDKLANEGAILRNYYTMSQCTPSRVALFTGRFPSRWSLTAQAASNFTCFPLGVPTLANMFKSAGYKTYLSGKWHMSLDTEFCPNKYGFDSSYGSLAGAIGMYKHQYRNGIQTWHRDGKLIEGSEDGTHTTDLITREAERVIREDKGGLPFFLMLSYNAVHTPLDERGDFVDTPTQLDPKKPEKWLNEDKIEWFHDPDGKIQQEKNPDKRLFLAVVNHLDSAIGKVIDSLSQTGQLDNTLIIFTSDNGPQVNWSGNAYPDDLKLKNFNQKIPFRGHKIDVFEGGIRVPGFVYWKGKIEPRGFDELIHIVDWFPMLSKIAGADVSSFNLDGADAGRVLLQSDAKGYSDRKLYWLWGSNSSKWAVRDGDWKMVYNGKFPSIDEWSLFNLKEDPYEKINLAKSNPEKVKELNELFLNERAADNTKIFSYSTNGPIEKKPASNAGFKKSKKDKGIGK